ncbi:phosphatase PAP2 family protein [Motilibacter aurantiacus]|uniref:phosphatase PAP2 family protein n=1 Tax=Motilibacter aurantiacus TaxID=2714955 RepID=UPI00140BC870|nr:phosphatase PAP2 family protein [Motilibacter aurantiacus]NHC46632.1 phosphatase PAP2 family protein [Motilibacter aurantiacus]
MSAPAEPTVLPSAPPAPRRRYGRPVTVALLLGLAVACALAVAATYRVFVGSQTGQLVEAAALGGTDLGRDRLLPRVTQVLDVVSVAALAVAVLVIAAIGLLRGRWRSALVAGALVAGANVTTQLLKKEWLTRPDFGGSGYPENTLPSGHTTVAASVAAAAVLVAPRRLRPLVALVGCAYAVVTGVATLAANWHRPSDAIAAYPVVLGWGALLAAVVVAFSPPAPGRGAPDRAHRVVGLFLGSCAVPVAAGAAVAIVMTADRVPGPLGEYRRNLAYAGGAAAIVAVGLLAMALWLAVVTLIDEAGRRSRQRV